MRFFDDGDDGAAAAGAVETFLITQESAITDIILTESGEFLEQEVAP